MSILGLDVGNKRIGVAMSEGSVAVPLTTILRKRDSSAIEEILTLVREYEADEIVVGMPLSLSGEAGQQAERTARFAEALAKNTSVPVSYEDERYSSVEAERLMRESGAKPSRDKARVDAAAAAVILQSYLGSKRARD